MNSNVEIDKLRPYRLIKQQVGFEKYLEVLPDRKQHKALEAFRTSAHKLQTEHRRYLGQNLEDRVCSACKDEDEMHGEDEIHFCDCIKYFTPRNQFLQMFNSQNISSVVSNKDHFINLMTSTDNAVLKSI